MNAYIGLSRVFLVITILGWLWAAFCFIAAYGASASMSARVVMVVLGLLGPLTAYVVAWIIRGFAGPDRE